MKLADITPADALVAAATYERISETVFAEVHQGTPPYVLKSFWRRVKVAWRYVFNDVCGYGDCAEVYLSSKDLKKIQGWAE